MILTLLIAQFISLSVSVNGEDYKDRTFICHKITGIYCKGCLDGETLSTESEASMLRFKALSTEIGLRYESENYKTKFDNLSSLEQYLSTKCDNFKK